jgi:hypothetical protein
MSNIIVKKLSEEQVRLLAKYDYSNLTKEEKIICSKIIRGEYQSEELPQVPVPLDKSEVS